jgi:CBS domain containing-hemolysin-like protein
MLVKDLENELKLEFSPRDEDTVAGLVLSELGRTPKVGDRVRVGPLELEVQEVQRRRIRSLVVTVNESNLEDSSPTNGRSNRPREPRP